MPFRSEGKTTRFEIYTEQTYLWSGSLAVSRAVCGLPNLVSFTPFGMVAMTLKLLNLCGQTLHDFSCFSSHLVYYEVSYPVERSLLFPSMYFASLTTNVFTVDR